ncbi:MAG: hypothetical protein MGG37_20490 [Trichodesmium sp. MAG_R01]|nr:hypothetical protein [Trichodesmium sp. MAG_R01]
MKNGQRKSGDLTAGVGQQYIGEIVKTDNGMVVVTTHLYDRAYLFVFRYSFVSEN